MGLTKYSFEQLRYESYGLSYEAVIIEQKKNNNWSLKKNVPSDIREDSGRNLGNAYEEYFNNPDRYDEERDNALTGYDREY